MAVMGCTSSQLKGKRVEQQPDIQTLMLTNLIQYRLLTPSSLGTSLAVTQVANIQTNENHYELIFKLEITASQMRVVGILPSGIKLFTIIYDGKAINSQGNADIMKNIKPQYLLADIQLSLWPVHVLKEQWFNHLNCFKRSSCTFHESKNQLLRRISVNNDAIISIEFDKVPPKRHKSIYVHHQRNYRIELETMEP